MGEIKKGKPCKTFNNLITTYFNLNKENRRPITPQRETLLTSFEDSRNKLKLKLIMRPNKWGEAEGDGGEETNLQRTDSRLTSSNKAIDKSSPEEGIDLDQPRQTKSQGIGPDTRF